MATYIRRREFLSTLCGIAVAWPSAARAQTYPSRPITMVVPAAAGGSFDVIGRILAARMSEILGQQVIVENTSGGATIIGVNRVVNAAPDGYTLLFGSIGTMPIIRRSIRSRDITQSPISRRSRCLLNNPWC